VGEDAHLPVEAAHLEPEVLRHDRRLVARLDEQVGGEEALGRLIYATWRRGETAIDVMAADVVWDFSRRQVEPEIYRGREGVRRFARQLLEAWSELRQEPSEYLAAGERALVLIAIEGRGRASGVRARERIAHVWTLRDGRVAALKYFGDIAEAQRALR
jgi:ketosteroid isomerase-like protein